MLAPLYAHGLGRHYGPYSSAAAPEHTLSEPVEGLETCLAAVCLIARRSCSRPARHHFYLMIRDRGLQMAKRPSGHGTRWRAAWIEARYMRT